MLLALAVLFVAPFLHGSARNQAFQADAAKHAATGSPTKLPKLPQKEVTASTWVVGHRRDRRGDGLTAGGYRFSGKLARRRVAQALPPR